MSAEGRGEYSIQRFRDGWAIVWWVVDDDGTRRRKRHELGASDRTAAGLIAAEFWKRRKLGGAATVGALVETWLDAKGDLVAIGRARDGWKAAKGFFGELSPALVTEAACKAYALKRGRAARTVRVELMIVGRALRWAAHPERRLIERAPAFWYPPLPDREVRSLTKAQFRRFLDGCHAPHVRLFAEIAVATGARATALLELQWDQVDLARGVIQLNRQGRTQTDKRRANVPITAQLRPSLEAAKAAALSPYVIEHAGGRVLSVKKGIAAAAQRSGVRATPHWFRHSAAVWMAEADVPMAQIAQYLGHEDQRTTERDYARFSPSFLRGAAAALSW